MQVSALLADFYDDVVLDIWNEAIAQHLGDARLSGVSLIAHGGFGRRDLAPYSDADLMILSTRKATDLANKVAGNLTRDLTDCGITPGLSIRTPREACAMSWSDPVIFSSLTESRLLAGSLQLYKWFFDAYRHGSRQRSVKIIRSVVDARREERSKWGETSYLLRPNVKRSRGALRDIQLIRWLGFARFGETDMERLLRLGALPQEDYRLLRKSYAFMLRLRHELHFRAGKSQDVLDRATQMEIADSWGYEGAEATLPVEQFMQDYFETTRNVRYAAGYFVDDSKTRSLGSRITEAVFSRRIDDNISMGPRTIWVRENALTQFASNLADVLRLMNFANQHQRRISHKTWQAIRVAMINRDLDPDQASIDAFLSLLTRPGRLASLLSRLHELRIIEQLIPEFRRMRGLLQFNAYHKYTVDAHSLLAVEAATKLQDDQSGMGRRYRRIKDKRLLHLALLIHDIGKGYEEDHCIVGERIAADVAGRLGLDPDDGDTLKWLVRKHLEVNVIAFRHDLSDPQIVLSFAAEVGSIRRLEMLVVHTYADLTAVGPGVVTDWKLNLIEDLYRKTRRYFDSGDLPGSPNDPVIEKTKQRLLEFLNASLSGQVDSGESASIDPGGVAAKGIGSADQSDMTVQQKIAASQAFVDDLPLSLLSRGDAESLGQEVLQVLDSRWNNQERTVCTAEFDTSIDAMRYTVIRKEEDHSIGTFARTTAALSASGLSIMRAQIERVEDYVWDYFWVIDPDVTIPKPGSSIDHHRSDELCRQIKQLLDTPDLPLPKHRRTWSPVDANEPMQVNVLPKNVVFDNKTVDRYTIISLFAYNQVGLLSRIAAALASLDLVLSFAKIDTHLDQVADVFYVSESSGEKLTSKERQNEVRETLLNVAG